MMLNDVTSCPVSSNDILVQICPELSCVSGTRDASNKMKWLIVLYGEGHLTLLSFILELISMLVTVMGLA